MFGHALPLHLLRSLTLIVDFFRRRERGALNTRTLASRRSRRAALSGLMTMLSGGLKMLGSLITLPLVMRSVGAEGFGVWVTLTSLMALSALGDLGIGNGLINAVSRAHGTDDQTSAKTYVSSAFLVAMALSCALVVAFVIFDAIISWPLLFNLSSPKIIAEVDPAVKVLVGCVVVNVLLGIGFKVRIGYQEVHINMLWEVIGIVCSIAALVFFIWLNATLPWLVFAETGVPLIAIAVNISCLFVIERPWLRPALSSVKFAAIRQLFNLGLLFLVLHLAGIFAFSSDNLLAIWISGPEAAGLYAIAMKLFSPGRLIAGAILGPLWPAYGEALARGDIVWVRRTIVASIVTAVAVVLPLVVLSLFFGNDLIRLWFQRPISLGFGLLAGGALWVVLEAVGSGLATFLNGASVLRAQIPLSIAFAATAIVAKVALQNQFGIAGIIWGTIVAFSITQVVPYTYIIHRYIREHARQSAVLGASVQDSPGVP